MFGRKTANALGLFSLALGAAELLRGRRIGRGLGLERLSGLIRGFGVREIVTGVGLLAARNKAPWIMARVAGDALDLAALGRGARHGRRGPIGLAGAAVAGVTLLDVLTGLRARRRHQPAWR